MYILDLVSSLFVCLPTELTPTAAGVLWNASPTGGSSCVCVCLCVSVRVYCFPLQHKWITGALWGVEGGGWLGNTTKVTSGILIRHTHTEQLGRH